MNASFDRSPARFDLRSARLILIDPLALDGLSAELIDLSSLPAGDQSAKIQALGQRGLRIGLTEVEGFRPGTYELDVDSFESVDPVADDPGIFEVDSGAVVVVDLSALDVVARALTWDRYDDLLRGDVDDFSALEAVNADAGGSWFAILSADADAGFRGDGAYRLRAGLPRRVT